MGDRVDKVDYATFAAVLATAFAAGQLVPQVIKLRRSQHIAGVSPTWAALGVVANAGWVVYRWSQELWLGLPSPVIAAMLYGTTFWLLSSIRTRPTAASLTAAAWGALLVVATLSGGWPVLGGALVVTTGVQVAPSVWTAFRTPIPFGIASGVWWAGLAQGSLWATYGWLHADGALKLYGVGTCVAAALILGRRAWTVTQSPERSARRGIPEVSSPVDAR